MKRAAGHTDTKRKRIAVDSETPHPRADRPKLHVDWEFEDPVLTRRRRQVRRFLGRLTALVALSTAVTVWVASGADERAQRRGYDAAVESDLMRLVEVQAAFFETNGRYGRLDELGARYISSQGVRVRILAADAQGWSATAWHLLTSRSCSLGSGRAAVTLPEQTPDTPECR
ncbi:MAG: hypothetical protein O7I93_10520 [Gemmatimonadetes bacterium]|nr:hypothetical protein [Gemmatimonadota bacterium]